MDANSSAKLRDAAKVAYVRSSIQVSITPCTDVAWSLQLFQARLAKTKKLKGDCLAARPLEISNRGPLLLTQASNLNAPRQNLPVSESDQFLE